jgi:hypothetical protein
LGWPICPRDKTFSPIEGWRILARPTQFSLLYPDTNCVEFWATGFIRNGPTICASLPVYWSSMRVMRMLTFELAWGDRVSGCVRGKTSILNAEAGMDEGTGLQVISLSEITSGLYNNSRIHLV